MHARKLPAPVNAFAVIFLLLWLFSTTATAATFDFTDATGTGSKTVQQTIGSDTVVFTATSDNMMVDTEANAFGSDVANASGNVMASGSGGINYESKIRITVAGGKSFNLSSFTLVDIAGEGKSLTITTDKGSLTIAAGFSALSWPVSLADAIFEGIAYADITTGHASGQFSWGFDNIVLTASPTVTDANIGITSSGSGIGGAYKIGDTVTAQWNNTAGGDNNVGITGVTMDFSQFGGGAAVAATESAGIWTASYLIVSGNIETSNRNVSVSAGNAVGVTTVADGSNLTVDNVAPTVTSIDRYTPAGATTNADTLIFQVTFSQAVDWLSTGDFAVTGTTAYVTSVNTIVGNTYAVTVSGGDLAGVNGTVTLGFSGVQNITDTVGNPLTNTTPTGTNNNSYTLDNTPPRITSIVRQTPATSLTNANSLVFRVTFGETVSNVTNADFAASGTTATASVSAVSGTTYDVTLSGGNLAALDGTVSLGLAGGQDIADALGNVLTNTTPTGANESYTLDNTPPGACTGALSVAENAANGTVVGTVSATDAVSYSLTDAAGGRFAINAGTGAVTVADGSLLDYEAATSHSITIRAFDAAGNSADTLRTVSITNVNDNWPVITEGAGPLSVTMSEDSSPTPFARTLHATDADGATTFTWSISSPASHGTASASGTGSSKDITYIPNPNYNGSDSFTVRVSDGVNTDSVQINVTIEALDDAPIIDQGVSATLTVVEDGNGPVTLTGTEVDGQALTWSVSSAPTHGGVGFAGGAAGSKTFTYTPDANFNGSDTFDVTVSDVTLTDTITVNVTVTAVNDKPSFVAGGDVTINPGSGTAYIGAGWATALSAGPADEVGQTLMFVASNDNNGLFSVQPYVDGTGALRFTPVAAAGGTATVTLYLKDDGGTANGGNDQSPSVTFHITLDNWAAAPSAPDLTAGSDSGSSSTDNVTNDTTPTVTGNGAEAGATVRLYDTDGTTVLGTAMADGSGNWSITSSALAEGIHTLTARQTDLVGNVSAASTGLSITIDTTAAAPAGLHLDPASDTGASSTDNLTSDTTPTVAGTAEPGATITLYDTDGTTSLGTVTADGSGNWSITSSTLGTGSHTLTARQTDIAGNTSSASAGLSVTIDTSAPTITSVSVPGNATYAAGQDLDFTVNWNENVVFNTSGGTPRIALTVGSSTVYATYRSGSGTSATLFRYTVQPGNMDTNGITVGALGLDSGSITDTAGNNVVLTLNSVGSTAAVLVDTLIPTAAAATSAVATGFTANWNAVAGASGYRLDVSTSNTFGSFVGSYNNMDVGSATSQAVTGLNPSTTYYYRVRAYNGGGTSGNSGTITVLTVPSAPTAAAASAITFSGLTANWSSVTGATGYYLDVATDNGFTSMVTGFDNLDVGNVTTKAVTGLSASTGYYYRVRAYNTGGTGGNSNTVNPTTATTRIVTKSADTDDGICDADCSLREAIAAANSGDTINFDPGLNGQTITLDSTLFIVKNLTISGPGAANLTISGNDAVQIFGVYYHNITLQGLTLTKGLYAFGAALYVEGNVTTTISNCIFTDNHTTTDPADIPSGGAIWAAFLTVSDTHFSNNSAFNNGGAIRSYSSTISNSTFSGNSAQQGGGIHSNGDLNLINVTFSGNSATSGGGVFNQSGTPTLTNVTVSGNSAMEGGGIYSLVAPVTIRNSIIANNTASIGPDIYGDVNSQGYNLIKNTTNTVVNGDSTGNIIDGTDPLLGPLADNGGPTQTMLLRSGSPAIGSGNCTSGPATDQRGMARPQNATCDMGAYERGVPAALTATDGTPQSTTIGTAFSTTLRAKVVDSLGVSLDGISVSFAGPGSGAGISAGGSVTTDIAGVASFGVTANGAAGTYSVVATAGSLSAGFTLTNTKADQTVTFTTTPPPAAVVGGSGYNPAATGGVSGNPVVVSINSGSSAICALSGGVVTFQAAGTCTINANQAGNADYNPAPQASQSFSVGKGSATVTLGNLSQSYDGTPKPVTADTTPTGKTVILSYAGTGGTSYGPSSTAPTSPGSYSVTGTISDANYQGSVTGTLTIGKGDQTVTLGTAPAIGYGGTGTVSATATSGLTVTLASTTPAVCSLSGTTVIPLAVGTCTITADQAGNGNYNAATQVTQSFAIGKASQTITFGTAPEVFVGTTGTVSATATSRLAVSFTSTTPTICSVTGTTVTGILPGTCTIAADQAGNTNYNAATQATQSMTVVVPLSLVVSTLTDGAVTTESTLNVCGLVSNPTFLSSLTINGVTVQVGTFGLFSYPVQLIAGANAITVIATSTVGDVLTDSRTLTLNTSAPHLTISYPADNTSVMQQFMTVTGTVTRATATAVTCTVNGGTAQTAAISGGGFTCTVNLAAGMNTIQVAATDSTGSTAQAKRTVYHSPGFSLAVTDPASDIRTVQDTYVLTGTVAENTSPVTVTVTIDGQSYTPTVTNGTFQQSLPLTTAKVYQIGVSGVDQNSNTVSVQRNIIRTVPLANGSSTFTIVDALLALQMAVGLVPPQTDQILRMDVAPMVNGVSVGDGIIDVEDAIVILRMVVGLI